MSQINTATQIPPPVQLTQTISTHLIDDAPVELDLSGDNPPPPPTLLDTTLTDDSVDDSASTIDDELDPVNNEDVPMEGGFYRKYMKYKTKYLLLKKQLSTHNINGK